MTEAEYTARCEGFRKRRWMEDRAVMFMAFIFQKLNADNPIEDFDEFYPELDSVKKDLPTDDEIDKMFEECQ